MGSFWLEGYPNSDPGKWAEPLTSRQRGEKEQYFGEDVDFTTPRGRILPHLAFSQLEVYYKMDDNTEGRWVICKWPKAEVTFIILFERFN